MAGVFVRGEVCLEDKPYTHSVSPGLGDIYWRAECVVQLELTGLDGNYLHDG